MSSGDRRNEFQYCRVDVFREKFRRTVREADDDAPERPANSVRAVDVGFLRQRSNRGVASGNPWPEFVGGFAGHHRVGRAVCDVPDPSLSIDCKYSRSVAGYRKRRPIFTEARDAHIVSLTRTDHGRAGAWVHVGWHASIRGLFVGFIVPCRVKIDSLVQITLIGVPKNRSQPAESFIGLQLLIWMCSGRKTLMVVMVFMESQSDLFQVVPGLCPVGCLPSALDGWSCEHDAHQNNGDQYQARDHRSRCSTTRSVCGFLRIGTVLIAGRKTVLDHEHEKYDQTDQRHKCDQQPPSTAIRVVESAH